MENTYYVRPYLAVPKEKLDQYASLYGDEFISSKEKRALRASDPVQKLLRLTGDHASDVQVRFGIVCGYS